MKKVAVLDYGSGNTHSIVKALQFSGAEVDLTSNASQIRASDGVVVPGVGAFSSCMQGISSVGGVELIKELAENQHPILGICVGHQILFQAGTEHGIKTRGIGLLRGEVVQLPTPKVPHIGWNQVEAPDTSRIFSGLHEPADTWFYFVHSNAVLPSTQENSAAEYGMTKYQGIDFLASVEQGSVTGTQFHPEKSGVLGIRLLANWIK